jgi:hypothetical protein
LNLLPHWGKESVYYAHYHTRHRDWGQLFKRAPLALCPEIAMYDLVPGDVISGCIAFNGFYDWSLTKRIAQGAGRGGLFVDVGANMGYFPCFGSALVGLTKLSPLKLRLVTSCSSKITWSRITLKIES